MEEPAKFRQVLRDFFDERQSMNARPAS
jgi:hypothetical protein